MARRLSQEQIVFALAVLLFLVFAATLPNFLTAANILTLVRSVAVLGILGVGMAVVVIGRGIDLSIVAVMAMSVAWALGLANTGLPLAAALLLGFGFAVLMGLITGVLIAYVEIPPLFATLAMAAFVYGFARAWLIGGDVTYMPPGGAAIAWIGSGRWGGIPVPILLAAAACALAFLFLRFTNLGRYVYGMGDNLAAARITGIPVRPMIVLQYMLSAAVAFGAGLITATAVGSMNTRVVFSTLIYDVILVVVLGGVGLSGGRGGVRNVIVGTLLIGTLLDGMTIMDVQYTVQNVVKSCILLAAIVVDSLVNPRDEQTAQQGDI